MKLGDPVRAYDDEDWFSEGHVTSIGEHGIQVDFLDWVKLYQPSDLILTCEYYREHFRAIRPGVVIQDYRLDN